ncbi:MAG: alpha/beta hydrolase [Hyphomicrobiales bacterium]
MPTFDSDGVRIAYDVEGEGEPVLLVHGFASTAAVNWGSTSWIDLLKKAGRRVVTIDNRGHGQSEKLYDPAAYEAATMAEDLRRLLDTLSIESADVMGYSMGARLSALLAIAHPTRVRSLVLGGLAGNMINGVPGSAEVIAALEAPSLASVTDPMGRSFRRFAEQTKSDLAALAACMRSSRVVIDPAALRTIQCPVLIVVGDADDIAGPIGPIAEAIPDAETLVLKGKDHMRAVTDQQYRLAVLDFLDRATAPV